MPGADKPAAKHRAKRRQPKQRQRPTRDQTRARLMLAARQIFAAKGYEGGSLNDVATAAGLTKGAVYSSFASKQDLFYALMQESIGERLMSVEGALKEQSPPEQGIRPVDDGLRSLLTTEPDWQILFIEFWAHAVRTPAMREDFAHHRRQAREIVGKFIEQLASEFEIDLPVAPNEFAVIVLALANGMAIEQLADPEAIDPALFGLALSMLIPGLASTR